MVFLGILVAQFCNLVISANPPGYGVINCDPEQGYLIFPRCLNESGTSNSVWIDVDSGGTLFRYLQYNSNMQCEGTPNFNVTFGPQCAFLNAVKLDFTFGVPPSPPVDPPVTPPVEAPLEPPVDAPVLAPVAVPMMAPVDENNVPVQAPVNTPTAAPSKTPTDKIKISGSDFTVLVSDQLIIIIGILTFFV
jgi:hypothetical protein